MRKRITLKKKSDPGQFAIPCTVKGGAFQGIIHFCGLFPEELRRNFERPRGADCLLVNSRSSVQLANQQVFPNAHRYPLQPYSSQEATNVLQKNQ
ncbi:hypothetical protein DY000_02031410 [Brassica cretica]|uniref:Uncharacterized protein n=1 Tax=Brassica cretica TaxID=69181 RepID=A0ABQ7DU27_BRACR|nr:hypothetical protein DY000_02031410 [Brassica cretica]